MGKDESVERVDCVLSGWKGGVGRLLRDAKGQGKEGVGERVNPNLSSQNCSLRMLMSTEDGVAVVAVAVAVDGAVAGVESADERTAAVVVAGSWTTKTRPRRRVEEEKEKRERTKRMEFRSTLHCAAWVQETERGVSCRGALEIARECGKGVAEVTSAKRET